jgi:hypothetical protein
VRSARKRRSRGNRFIYDKRIDQKTYAAQKDKLHEETTLLEIAMHESRLEELDLEGLFAFAEHGLTDAADMWSEASLEQRTRLQAVFFPEGLATAVTCLAFEEMA